MTKSKRFFLVHEEILPESIVKAARAKEMILKGEVSTVNEAVERVNISRSAYYKYRDSVFPLQPGPREKDITLNLTLEHRTGVLSKVLSFIASLGGNIITIRQEMPVEGLARVCINIDISGMNDNIDTVLHEIKGCDGVKAVSLEGWNKHI
ncbi:MAG: ACT domain-containing protein [Bacillota bacterium]